MNDSILAAQYAKTGNIMDACQTEAWLKEAVAIEKEFGEPAAGVIA